MRILVIGGTGSSVCPSSTVLEAAYVSRRDPTYASAPRSINRE